MSSLHAGVRGETSSAPPGYLTPLLVAAPMLDLGSQKRRCASKRLSWALGGHIIGENPGSVSWFSFQVTS